MSTIFPGSYCIEPHINAMPTEKFTGTSYPYVVQWHEKDYSVPVLVVKYGC